MNDGPDTANPLLGAGPLPAFDAVRPEHVEPAVREMLAAQRAALARAERAAPTLDWLKDPELINVGIYRVWGPISHLNSVVSSPALRDAFNRCLPLVTEFGTELAQNEALYEHYGAARQLATPERKPVEAHLIALALRDFRLGGVTLTGEPRRRYRELVQQLAALQARFEQNLMDATDAFEHHERDRGALAGLPEQTLERARALAAERGQEGWLLRLDGPNYQAVMAHAESVALREIFYRAWCTRASDQGLHAERLDNGPLIGQILALRHENAQLLGFKSYGQLSLASKMAESPERVIEFLRDLARRSKPVAAAELEMLADYAGRELDAWDVGFYSERMRKERLRLAEEELRPYFPLPRVLDGLFGLVGRLFGLTLRPVSAPSVWHPAVQYYELRRRDGSLVGHLYADYFARPNKRGGAWVEGCVSRARLNGALQTPVAYLVCNFNPPVGDTPSLLSHSESVTLFHEFGHALHHLLTEVDYPSVAGMNGVAWDAVELPSQFLENFMWRTEVLAGLARHYKTGEPLPKDKLETLQKSRTFLSGLAMVRQLEFALFDFRLHHEYSPERGARVYETLAEVRDEVAVVTAPSYNRYPSNFNHVFGGGYAAGYYSYKWAEVLAADAFAAFDEAGIFDGHTAERFRRSILSVGGSRNALDAFVEFRGRPPELDALLRQAGIATARAP
ncbi:MAG TPA: M3 family metallopeptidase [Gammaproteobacteria bacterium]|nr:M3 family metallopeptidase [Gammaproteobacteria bacterium]